MVTPTDAQSTEFYEPDVPVDTTPTIEETEQTDLTPADDTEVAVEETEPAPTEGEDEQPVEPPPQTPAPTQAPASFQNTQPQIDQRSIDELQKRRLEDEQRQWKEKVGRAARAYEQQLADSGYMPEQARDQARRYIQQEQKFKKMEQDNAEMVGFVQGRQAAAVHFLKKHGLANQQVLNDFMALQGANTPEEMEREALRMKRERNLIAENTRLKQGRVVPQAFDNSQGSAEATTNQGRLLDAYLAGDRSEAAVRAARSQTFGV